MAEGSTETVTATELAPPHTIRFSWSDGIDVAIRIQPFEPMVSRVFVEARGFTGDDPAGQVVAATAGFTIVLCDLKSLLESGRSAGFVHDKAILISADASSAP